MELVGEITVKTEVLDQEGNNLETIIKNMKTKLSEVNSIIGQSASYWIGNAGDSLRRSYVDINTEIEETLNELSEYPNDLRRMAGIYKKTDIGAIQMAEELPDGVLE